MKNFYLSRIRAKAFQTAFAALIFSAFGLQTAMAQEICANERGEQDGYDYEFWSEAGQGSSCMELGSGATFSAEWSGIKNYLARRGLGYEEMTQKHQYLGWFTADYTVDYNPTCSVNDSNSYMGVYGWTLDRAQTSTAPFYEKSGDLVEWYIIENWCNWIPSQEQGSTKVGTINIDGSNYDVIKYQKVNAPSIRTITDDDATDNDVDTFWQYFSIRQNTRNTGTINVSAHFAAWEKLGLPMGNLYEVSMLVEGYAGGGNGQGSANFTSLNVTATERITFGEDSYQVRPGETLLLSQMIYKLGNFYPNITVTSSNTAVANAGGLYNKQYLMGLTEGNVTITLKGPDGTVWDTATVSVSNSAPAAQLYAFRALGTKGTERVAVRLDGQPTNSGHTLSTDFQTYSGTVYGKGDVSVEFVNDDGVANGRDVRLDYLSVDGQKRETEQMASNSAVYANGSCGGGGYSEWLHCSGAVNFGQFEQQHTITIRARGNAGGEHIALLINGQPVNGGWWLGTSYQEYTATVVGGGDINVKFDNDGGLRDVVIDWVQVDDQALRQAESMQYNTGAFANGRCGGGSYTQWMHCNGVIGFGNIAPITIN